MRQLVDNAISCVFFCSLLPRDKTLLNASNHKRNSVFYIITVSRLDLDDSNCCRILMRGDRYVQAFTVTFATEQPYQDNWDHCLTSFTANSNFTYIHIHTCYQLLVFDGLCLVTEWEISRMCSVGWSETKSVIGMDISQGGNGSKVIMIFRDDIRGW